ncbi:MAG: DUF1573 domain-containing protein [Flavobacterium sp.]
MMFVFVVSCSDKSKYSMISATKEINFGTIHSNEKISKVFKIKNASANDLVIKNVKTSCGCTAAKLKDSVVKENETLDLEVNFFASKEKIGKVKNSIVIEANTSPIFTVLYLKGNVVD